MVGQFGGKNGMRQPVGVNAEFDEVCTENPYPGLSHDRIG
jgi:hypothetical protein